MSEPNPTPTTATNSLRGRLRLKKDNDFHMQGTPQGTPVTPNLTITPSLTPQTSTNQTTPALTGLTTSTQTTDKPKPALKLKKDQTFTLDSVPGSQTKAEPTPLPTQPIQMNTNSASFIPQPQPNLFNPVFPQ